MASGCLEVKGRQATCLGLELEPSGTWDLLALSAMLADCSFQGLGREDLAVSEDCLPMSPCLLYSDEGRVWDQPEGIGFCLFICSANSPAGRGSWTF